MPPILHLEFASTDAEQNEAQSLSLRHQFGGSKWRTNLALYALLVLMLVGAWFRFREIPEGYRALVLGAVVGGSVLFVYWKKKIGGPVPETIQLEISETNVTLLAAGSRVMLPWSAFSQCLESPDLFVLVDRSKQRLTVIPKRAFPDDTWQTWFGELATSATSRTTPARDELLVPEPTTSADRIAITVHPRFRDYLAWTVASWRTRGFCIGLVGLMLGVFLFATANPPPNVVNPPAKLFVLFVVPFIIVLVTMIVIIFSVHSWRLHVKYVGPEEIALSDESMAFSGANGSGTFPCRG